MSAMNKLKEEFIQELTKANTNRENLLKQRNQIDAQLNQIAVQTEQLKGAIYALGEAEARQAADDKAVETKAEEVKAEESAPEVAKEGT